MNPFDMTGPEFLAFYFVIFLVGLVLAIWLRWQLKKPAPPARLAIPELSPYEVACLSGGKPVVLQAAMAALVQRGVVQVSSDGKKVETTAPLPNDATPVEAELYDHIRKEPDCSLRTVFRVDSDEVTRLTRALEEKGLLVNESDAGLARFLPVLVMLTVAGIGAAKIAIGLSHNRPVEFLFVFVILTVVIAFAGFARRVFRSQHGEAVLERLRQEHGALQATASTDVALSPIDLPLAVGLFGLGVLTLGPLANLRQTLQASPPNAWVNGGGCGGGGCGGG